MEQAQIDNRKLLQQKMSLGESSLKPMNRAVYLFGNSGCGKSTFANYSAGRELVVIKKKIQQVVAQEPKIAIDTLTSTTEQPVILESQQVSDGSTINIIDGPGNGDTGKQGENPEVQEIANTYYNYRVLQQVSSAKFILVTAHSSLDSPCTQFIKTLELFTKMNKDVNVLKKSFSILITRVPNTDVEEEREIYLETMQSMIKHQYMLSQGAKVLLQIGIDRLFLFPIPPNGPIINDGLFNKLQGSMEYLDLDVHRNNFDLLTRDDLTLTKPLYESSQELLVNKLKELTEMIIEYIQFINSDSNKQVETVKIIVKKQILVENKGIKQIFKKYSIQEVEEEVIQHHIHYKQVIDIDMFLVLNDIINKVRTNAISLESLRLCVIGIVDVLSKNQTDDEKLQTYIEMEKVVAENIQFVGFLMAVCNQQQIKIGQLQDLFTNVSTQLSQAMDRGVNDISVIPSGRNFSYYEKLIDIYNQPRYNNDAKFNSKRAQSNFEMGSMRQKEGKYIDSVIYLYKALTNDPTAKDFPLVYECLADCYYKEKKCISNKTLGTRAIHDVTAQVFLDRLLKTSIIINTLLTIVPPPANPPKPHLAYLQNLSHSIQQLTKFSSLHLTNQTNNLCKDFITLLNLNENIIVKDLQQQKNKLKEKDKQQKLDIQKKIDEKSGGFKQAKLQFEREVDGMLEYNRLLQNNKKADKINEWFNMFQGLLTTLKKNYFEQCSKIQLQKQDKLDLTESITFLSCIPKCNAVRLLIAKAYFLLQESHLTKPNAKIDILRKSLSFDQANRLSRKQLAALLFDQGCYKDAFDEYKMIPDRGYAKKCLQEMINKQPSDSSLRIQQGDYLASIWEYSLATQAYNAASDILCSQPTLDQQALLNLHSSILSLHDHTLNKTRLEQMINQTLPIVIKPDIIQEDQTLIFIEDKDQQLQQLLDEQISTTI